VSGSTGPASATASAGSIPPPTARALAYCEVDINVEPDLGFANAPRTINFGSTSNQILNCNGNISFGAGFGFTPSNSAGNSQFIFSGPIIGDNTLTQVLQGSGTNGVFGAGTNGDKNPRVQLGADGAIRFGLGSGAVDTAITRPAVSVIQMPGLRLGAGSLNVQTAGQGVKIAEGSNAKQGTIVLNGTTAVVVSNTSVTASSRIFMTHQSISGAPGVPYVSARTPGTSFSVTSAASTDLGTVAYEIFEPG
jgi:hypothetical protein